MTTEKEQTASRAAHGESVLDLHEQWTRVLGRISAGPLRRLPKLTRAEKAALLDEARTLERRIAGTPSRSIAEVGLKLKMAACSLIMPGGRQPLVDSAARDLLVPGFGNPDARADPRRRGVTVTVHLIRLTE